MLWLLLSFAIFGADAGRSTGKCMIFMNYKWGDLKEPQPLILTDNGSYNFLYPQKRTGELTLTSHDKFVLSCPGKGNFVRGIPGMKRTSEIEVKCLKGSTFLTNDIPFNFTSVFCNYLPFHETRIHENTCFRDGTHVTIGFQLKKDFLPTVEVCRDDKTYSTYHTKFFLSKNIAAHHAGFPRPYRWISGGFYGDCNMDMSYKTRTQLKTVAKLLDSEKLASKYINATKARFIARGHLTAKADFVYGSVQRSTFWYLNSAPQWQTFNGGNWNSLEDNIRTFANKMQLNLVVYTGTFGQMSLTDENNNQVPMYLIADGENSAIPVPQFFWKIIYDPERMLGTAFVGVNDPYAEIVTDDMFICDDIAEKISWLTWQSRNIYKGISYACDIDNLRSSVPSVPALKVKGLLY